MREFRKELRDQMSELGMDLEMARRYLNDGFSGGEKKRMEILQLAMLKPKFAVLDETDSGLDSDAVKVVSEGLNRLTGPGWPYCRNGRCQPGRGTSRTWLLQRAGTSSRCGSRRSCRSRLTCRLCERTTKNIRYELRSIEAVTPLPFGMVLIQSGRI